MSLFLNGEAPTALYVGTEQVVQAYLGTHLVYDGTRAAVVFAPRMTATVAARVPVPHAGQTVAVPPMLATADVGLPTVTASAVVAAPAMTASASAIAGVVSVPVTVEVPPMTSSALLGADVDAGALEPGHVVSPRLEATASMPVPVVNAGVTVTVPAMTATVDAVLAAIGAAAAIVPSGPQAATAAAAVPVVHAGANVVAPAATATATGRVPVVSASANPTVPAMTATATALVPVVPPVSVVAAASAGGPTPVVCNKPTGTASGDVMIAIHFTDNDTLSAMTAPAGWTLLTSLDRGSSLEHIKIWTKTAGGSEASTYSWAQGPSGTTDGCVTIITLRDADPSTANWLYATPVWAANSATRVAPTVVGAPAGSVLICTANVDMNNTSATMTHPSGMTELSDVQSRTWAVQGVASLLLPPNPTGTKTFTVSSSTFNASKGGIEWSVVVPAG
ncbi:hypothetical protein [Nocardia sp. NPDC049149]|uniref:hypothetical protein n=1 Tax=Nocardia sp. NPDC049149 TaxID=3364315 RepID=UPI0037207F54